MITLLDFLGREAFGSPDGEWKAWRLRSKIGNVLVVGWTRAWWSEARAWGGRLTRPVEASSKGKAAAVRADDALSGMDGMGIAGYAIRAGRVAGVAGAAQAVGLAATPQSSKSLLRAVVTAGP